MSDIQVNLRTRIFVAVITSLATIGMATSIAQAGPFFMGLGDLPGGSFASTANDISSDGFVVVGSSSSALGTEAFRWTLNSGMEGLGDLPGGKFVSSALGVSADGSVVVGTSFSESSSITNSSSSESFRWTTVDGMVGIGDLPGGNFNGAAWGVSADGSVVVGRSNTNNGDHAFRWTIENGFTDLGVLGGNSPSSRAFDVSSDGSVVVGESTSAAGFEAFRWTVDNGMVGLGDLSGGSQVASRAFGVSADGSTVVGTANAGSHAEAFRWTAQDGMISLGKFSSIAYATSGDGQIVVGSSSSSFGGVRAFIWDQSNGIRDLNDVLVTDFGFDLTGWVLNSARGISSDGLVIIGSGINPMGAPEAWIANLRTTPPPTLPPLPPPLPTPTSFPSSQSPVNTAIPEPSTLVLFVFGLVCIVIIRNKEIAY